jgi:hypothetical protein
LGTTIVKGQKIIPVGYGENAIKSIAENYLKIVNINPDATRYYKGKLKNLPAEKVAEAVARVKKYYPQLDIDDDEPSFLKLSDAIEAAEQRTSQKIKNASRISVSTGDSAAKGEFIDYYKQLSDLADKPFTFNIKPGGPKMLGVPMRKITSTSLQKLIIDIANDLNPNKSYNQTNLYVKKLDDGTIRIIDADDNIDLGQINEADINIPTQAASPEKRAAARAAKVIKPAGAPAFVFPNNIKTF